jgi:hypothetical protein
MMNNISRPLGYFLWTDSETNQKQSDMSAQTQVI